MLLADECKLLCVWHTLQHRLAASVQTERGLGQDHHCDYIVNVWSLGVRM